MSEDKPDNGDPATGARGRSVFEWLGALFGDDPADQEELLHTLKAAAERGVIDREALNIIFGAIHVSDMQVRDIMIPRSQLISICDDEDLPTLLATIIDSQHSRYPVVGDDLDDIKGILHAKDLLPLLRDGMSGNFDIKDCIRSATVVPESKRLNVLLQEFRSTRNHMALVVDEFGHVSGAVTIEDVLEQIVGEIEDEHDVHDDSYIMALENGAFNVKATTPVEDFNAYFDTEFSESEFDTIGGIVLQAFGHLPERGEHVELELLRFEVLNADARRLRLLRVRRLS